MKLFVERTDLKELKPGDRLLLGKDTSELFAAEVVEIKEDGVLVLCKDGSTRRLVETEEPQCR